MIIINNEKSGFTYDGKELALVDFILAQGAIEHLNREGSTKLPMYFTRATRELFIRVLMNHLEECKKIITEK